MYSSLFVCLFGIGTVFFGLACIILLVTVMSSICRSTDKKPVAVTPASAPAPAAAPADKSQLIAAVSVAIAEEMGTDVSGIRILSMKKI